MSLTRLHEQGEVMVVRTTLALKSGRTPGGLLYFCPERLPQRPEIIFLANGFAANHKTFTFRSRAEGGWAQSFADYLAKWGYILVIKDVGNERIHIEPTFEDHFHHVPYYAEAALRVVADELPRFCGRGLTMPDGVHWIGHSMGGMEVMAAKNRTGIKSFIAIASPTYMHTEERSTMRLVEVFAAALGVRSRFRNVSINAGLISKISDAIFKAANIESDRNLEPAQEIFVRVMAKTALINLIIHHFLNLEHLDLESAVAFFRAGIADETLYLTNEFAEAMLKGRTARDEVLGRPIQRFDMPVMAICGRGDNIAPPESVQNIVNFVNHPLKRVVVFDKYDHVGLLIRNGAEDHVWPHVVLFLKEQKMLAATGRTAAAREAKKAAMLLLDNTALGGKAAHYAYEVRVAAEKILSSKLVASA